MAMTQSEEQQPRRLKFRHSESVSFHLSVNGRHLPRWLARLLRPIERPVYRWLVRRQEKRWKESNRTTT
jgi:hypothetical protein